MSGRRVGPRTRRRPDYSWVADPTGLLVLYGSFAVVSPVVAVVAVVGGRWFLAVTTCGATILAAASFVSVLRWRRGRQEVQEVEDPTRAGPAGP